MIFLIQPDSEASRYTTFPEVRVCKNGLPISVDSLYNGLAQFYLCQVVTFLLQTSQHVLKFIKAYQPLTNLTSTTTYHQNSVLWIFLSIEKLLHVEFNIHMLKVLANEASKKWLHRPIHDCNTAILYFEQRQTYISNQLRKNKRSLGQQSLPDQSVTRPHYYMYQIFYPLLLLI